LTFDLPNRCRHSPTNSPRISRAGDGQKGRDMARIRSVHSQPKQHGPDSEEAETLLDLHEQYIRLYYSCIAKRLGVNASYINRVANGEHQSEKLRRALLSELGLMQAAA
jgi:hypothetical protein